MHCYCFNNDLAPLRWVVHMGVAKIECTLGWKLVYSCVICDVLLGHIFHLVKNLLVIVGPAMEVVFFGDLNRPVKLDLHKRPPPCDLKWHDKTEHAVDKLHNASVFFFILLRIFEQILQYLRKQYQTLTYLSGQPWLPTIHQLVG